MVFVQKTYWMPDREINQEMVEKKKNVLHKRVKDLESRSMYSFPRLFLLSVASPKGED